MKALFNRTFNRSTSLKDKDGKEAALAHSVAASLKSNPNSNANHSSNNSVPTLPPLSVWPPPSSSAPQRPLSSISQSSLKPLPEIVPSPRPLPPIFDEPEPIATSSIYSDINAKSRGTVSADTATTDGSASKHDNDSILQPQPKRVAFIASVPAPTSTPPSPVQFSETNNTVPSERKITSSSSDQSQFKLSFRPHLSSSSSSVIPTQKPSQTVLRVANPTIPISSSPPNTLSSTTRSVTSNSPTTTTTALTTTTSRGLSTPYRGPDIPSSQKESSSIRSGTPYSVMSANTSRILATASWSEAAEEDLVSNLGPRERTRQEVLWEIVASEERYVAELLKLKETFIDPLLHPFASASSSPPDAEYYSTVSPPPPPAPLPSLPTRAEVVSPIPTQQQESADYLPIAARFLSPLSFTGPTIQQQQSHPLASTPIIEGESDEEDAAGAAATAAKMNHPRSPYRQRSGPGAASNNNPNTILSTKTGNSTKPNGHPAVSTASLDDRERQGRFSPVQVSEDQRQSAASRISRKLKKAQPSNLKHENESNVLANGDAIPPHLLPADLRRCLEVIENGIVNGHFLLSEALRKRYEEQYPLVRSLADVFVSHSHILREYATYVLHLERALEQVDDALNLVNPSKRPKKQTEGEWIKLSRYLKRLEETASDKGETGLAISLSKPFQRLLKYPLLFQNLLFHTDPSTFEYESTLQMVAEVETIVRSIEDEKIQKEERDRTRDVFARIEGLEKIKQLAVPKPSRVLVGERMLSAAEGGMGGAAIISSTPERDTPTPAGRPNSGGKSNTLTVSTPPLTSKNVKGKSSFRRLSDVLQPGGSNGIGGKKDLWLVVFNDVVLRCQRTGMTSLPLSYTTAVSPSSNTAGPASRTASLPDLGKTKYATTGRRNSHTKPRNLYRFIKIETWAMTSEAGASASDNKRVGIVSMEDISRSRVNATTGASAAVPLSSKPIIAPMPEEDEDEIDSSDSDRKSKMSFSYWGADKVTLSHPVLNHGADGSSASGKGTTAANQHKIKTRAPLARGTVRRRPVAPSSYTSRESSANAKFGSRLVSQNTNGTNGDAHPPRSVSRKANVQNGSTTRKTNASNTSTTAPTTTTTTKSSQQAVEDTKSTVTSKPAWDGSTRATSTSSTTSPRRPRNVSQTSTFTKAGPDTTRTIKVSSSTPSEDSGVGLYKQIMAQDPSINR